MPRLDDASLYAGDLPSSLHPTLALLRRLLVATRARDAAAVPGLHAEAMVAGAGLAPRPVAPQAAEAAFVSGMLRVARYEQTVFCDDVPLVDTAGSRTLAAFRSDLVGIPEARIRAALLSAFPQDDATLAHIDARIAEESAQLALRHTVIQALDVLFPLRPGQPDPARVAALFGALYPGHPLRPDEITIIRTGTALFFCLPHDGEGRLTTRDPADPEAAQVAAFLATLTRFHPRQSAHFPSFGSLNQEDVPAAICAQVAAQAGVEAAVVAAILPTMVVVLPQDKVDQYIVHDAWGHGWQALLFRFEETYQRVSTYTHLPEVDAPMQRHDAAPVSLRAALGALAAGQVGVLEAWLQAATAQRLYDALANLTAEVLADVVEYKFLAQNPDQVDLMPSSSFVKTSPTKLDLTLWDLPMYYDRALQGFRRFAAAPPAVIARLAATWGVSPEVVQAAATHTGGWLERVHGTDLTPETTMGRTALAYLGMHVRFNALYERLRAEDAEIRFADALVFCVAAHQEEDWAGRFWEVDGLLLEFARMYRRFVGVLLG